MVFDLISWTLATVILLAILALLFIKIRKEILTRSRAGGPVERQKIRLVGCRKLVIRQKERITTISRTSKNNEERI